VTKTFPPSPPRLEDLVFLMESGYEYHIETLAKRLRTTIVNVDKMIERTGRPDLREKLIGSVKVERVKRNRTNQKRKRRLGR
jgi:hypothetical protein